MKTNIKNHYPFFIISCVLFFLGVVDNGGAVFIKSELENEKQKVNIFFTERCPINTTDRDKICGSNFSSEEFNHNGVFREASYEGLTQIITDITGYSEELRNISDITFNFYHISNKKQLELMLSFVGRFMVILSDVYEDNGFRIKNINVDYYYFDSPSSPYSQLYLGRWGWAPDTKKAKAELEKSIEEFKELKRRIAAKKKETAATRQDIERQFYKDNYPKANVHKGEYSSSSEESD